MPAKKGFTLIEVLFSLSITIVLSLISLPLLTHSLSPNLDKQAHQLLVYIDCAKSNALINHEKTYLNFGYDSLTITDQADFNLDYQLSDSHFDKGLQLYFNESGHINLANSITLIKGAASKKIVINLGTGHCYVK